MKSLRMTCVSAVVAAASMAGSLQAADGVLITERVTSGDAVQTEQVQLEKNRFRAEMADAAGGKTIVIFNGLTHVLDMVNVDRKTYTELTQADVERLGAQVQNASAMLQAQMANVPPAQRAQMEAMMAGRGLPGMAAPVKIEYRKTGTDRVGKWACDKYEGWQNGQKVSDLCTVDPAVLGFTVADFDVAREAGEMFKSLNAQGADQLFGIGRTDVQGFSGMPVRRVTTIAGKQTTVEVTDVGRQSFPDSLFVVPAGFAKQEFAAGAAGRAGRGR